MDVVFTSSERSYSDSPRAIEAELVRRGVPIRRRWLLPEGAWAPDEVERVLPGTEEARAAIESADYIVSNTYLLQRFEKKADALYLQTWHGTPLKRIGHDIRVPRHVLNHEVSSREDFRRWDLLLAPNSFTVPYLEDAFPGVEILASGYPRNDILSSPDADRVRTATRDQLGLAGDDVAVLYAPTWRDDDLSVRFGLDPEKLQEAGLDPHTVVLARSHLLTPVADSSTGWKGWRDVTTWPDISELYLAADVLITDYSSAMFDFAVTGKPMVFYTYDLEHYRDELRGFNFDFEGEAPGPLLRTPEELVRALERIGDQAGEYAERYGAFRERFCPLDDGRASQRVIDAVFGASPSP
ncbi:MAG: CDP-glycerol glycerophosphotransferase family protein [Solirubrobacterales bacterium]|nr:CDP-glycerol glycerophosphotransferase family protein [Solirubrobacterales bacterium]